MKLIKSMLVICAMGLLCSDLAVNLETHKMIKQIEATKKAPNKSSTPDVGVMQALSQVHLSGYQQRTILMQRIVGLEPIHGMHAGTKVQMCPGCNQPQPEQRQDNLTENQSSRNLIVQ